MVKLHGIAFILCLVVAFCLGRNIPSDGHQGVWELVERAIQPQASTGELKIGAFNIQVLGRSKMSKPDVVAILRKVVLFLPCNCYTS